MALRAKEGLLCPNVLPTFFSFYLFIQTSLRTLTTAVQPLIASVFYWEKKFQLKPSVEIQKVDWMKKTSSRVELGVFPFSSEVGWTQSFIMKPCLAARGGGWISTLSMPAQYFKSILVLLSHSPASSCRNPLIWLNYLFLCLHRQTLRVSGWNYFQSSIKQPIRLTIFICYVLLFNVFWTPNNLSPFLQVSQSGNPILTLY